MIRAAVFIIWGLLCSVALADLDVTVVKSRVLSGVSNPRVVGDVILYDGDQPPRVLPAAQITVVTDFKFVRVKARTSLFESSNVQQISEGVYLLTGSGKYAVEIIAFDPEKGIDEKVVQVELGDVQPDPNPPGPTPPGPDKPVPPDVFDNIGQRVAAATVSAPRKLEVAKVYRNAAIELRENQSVTVNGVFDKSFQERARIVGTNVAEWRAFSELLNADVKVRWPMSRMTVADYFDAVAVGLEAKQ
jgi:hypothetical protein